MADLQWIGIVDNQDTGEQVEAKLTTSFTNAENAITSLENEVLAITQRESVFASLVGQTSPLYSLTSTKQTIGGFSSSGNGNFIASSALNGTITPSENGWYRVSFMTSMTFTSSSVTRTISLDLVNSTDSQIVASSNVNIPKDATADAESLTAVLYLTANKSYKIDISSSVNMDITFDTMNFAVELVSY